VISLVAQKRVGNRAKTLGAALSAFGEATGNAAFRADLLVKIAETTKTTCDSIALAGGIVSLAEVAAEQGVAYACERVAQAAVEQIAQSIANEYIIDPVCQSLGIDPGFEGTQKGITFILSRLKRMKVIRLCRKPH